MNAIEPAAAGLTVALRLTEVPAVCGLAGVGVSVVVVFTAVDATV
jgi:hypothetical protein